VEREHKITWANLAISILGLLMVALMLSRPVTTPTPSGNLTAWALFSTLCILGATATLFPRTCSHTTRPPEDLEPSRYTTIAGIRLVHGHHPTCGSYSGHELEHGGKTYCAACTGLLMGAIAALAVATLGLVYRIIPPPITGYLGLAFVLLGLIYNPLLNITTPILRALINALFILGFSLILVAVDGHGNLGLSLLMIALSVYWMYTRIQLSSLNHDEICDGCEEPCEKKG
jgi:hypothetical protein